MNSPTITGFKSLAEIEGFLSEFQGRVGFVAGGTDLVLAMRRAGLPNDILIDLSQTEELNFIQSDGEMVHIGTATTMAQIAASPVIREQALCLAQAAGQMGSAQIRNLATLGGNIGSGSPAADSLPPLTALQAKGKVLTRRTNGFAYDDHLVIDVCGTQLRDQDLITEVSFPAGSSFRVSGFVKIGARSSLSIAKLSLALVMELDNELGLIKQGRLALGALGELPICPDNLELFLDNRKIDGRLGPDLADRLAEVVDGAIPARASRFYKSSAIKGAALDLIEQIFDPIAGGGKHEP